MSYTAIAQDMPANQTTQQRPSVLDEIKRVLASSYGRTALVVFAALCFAFFPLISETWARWFEKESYYSHGPLIPIISAYMIYANRDRLLKLEFKPLIWVVAPLLGVLYVAWRASITDQTSFLSVLFILAMYCSTLIVLGWRWLINAESKTALAGSIAGLLSVGLGAGVYVAQPRLAAQLHALGMIGAMVVLWLAVTMVLAAAMGTRGQGDPPALAPFRYLTGLGAGLFAPITYLIFALPTWGTVIDTYTNPLQVVSTKSAMVVLEMVGLAPMKMDETTILLGHYSLFVGVPCSGLKLVLSVTAFIVFFMIIARLSWWKNIILAAIVLPLCVAINGLRIAMIGIVGNSYGVDAGAKFHDYSGYIALVVCFFILSKLTRSLGWK